MTTHPTDDTMTDIDFSTEEMLPIERDDSEPYSGCVEEDFAELRRPLGHHERDDTDGPDEPPLARRPWPRLPGDDGNGGDGEED